MTRGRDPEESAAASARAESSSTRAMDLGDPTQPVDVADAPAPFARTTPPSRPIDLVSSTAANMLLADALPPTAAPEPSVPDPTPGLDTLFGDGQFRDYAAAPPTEAPARAAPLPPPRPPLPPVADEHHLTSLQRTLLAVMGGLLVLVALAGLFFVGTRLGASADPEPSASRAASPKPTPVPTVLPPGPVAVGVHRWDRLLGGECLGAFPGPWARTYTVVDCAAPHPAQLVYRGRIPDPATPGYPGQAELASRMSVLCSAPGVIDLAAASRYTDAQLEASYPVSAAQWDAGDHWYYCFVTRSSKEPLTGSVAVPRSGETPAP